MAVTDDASATAERCWVDLDDETATDVAESGGKAAALAAVRRADVETLPGIVLLTRVSEAYDRAPDAIDLRGIFAAASELAAGGPLVVRSSSVVEDASSSSAAGQFESVLDVDSESAFGDAVRAVFNSRRRAGAADEPIAVLVQPMVQPEIAGVCFGVDPVTGRSDHLAIAAVGGHPGRLVSGEVAGSRYVIDRHGGLVDASVVDGVELGAGTREQLTAAAARLAEVFGCPQDIEWAIVDGELLVLQSRPVTTEIRGVPRGPIFGPGPVAETFPERLTRLEADLWLTPLREAVRDALKLAAVASDDELQSRHLLLEVGGWVAIDLEITGEIQPRKTHPVRDRVRRLRSAWRVGRLKATLPHLVDELAARVDDDLEQLPPMPELTDRQLVAVVDRSRAALRSVHAHEMLLGVLSEGRDTTFTGASVALRVLAASRAAGLSDDEIIRRAPVVLALCAPRVGPPPELPGRAVAPDLGEASEAHGTQVQRETLRLRVRWLQEAGARAAWELAHRLWSADALPSPGAVRHVDLAELSALVEGHAQPVDHLLRWAEDRFAAGEAPLPSRFQLSDLGRPIALSVDTSTGPTGTGAGGGSATGPVTHDADDPVEGSILVVRTLAPGLGPKLPGLGGLIAETGSVLSHLAILAREQGVPTVVGFVGALQTFPPGAEVRVDGDTGAVEMVGDERTDATTGGEDA